MGIDCVYEQAMKRGIGNTLRMGEACACCRLARPCGNTMNDALTVDPPPRDAHQNKKEGERAIFVAFSTSPD